MVLTRGKFAVVLPYTQGQNYPSTPDRSLLFVPDEDGPRKKAVRDYFRSYYTENVDDEFTAHDDMIIVQPSHHGDLEVFYVDGGLRFILTFIRNEISELVG